MAKKCEKNLILKGIWLQIPIAFVDFLPRKLDDKIFKKFRYD
jgi:hypothetical protein